MLIGCSIWAQLKGKQKTINVRFSLRYQKCLLNLQKDTERGLLVQIVVKKEKELNLQLSYRY